MVHPMPPEAARLLDFLNQPHAENFAQDLVPLLSDFSHSVDKGRSVGRANAADSLALIKPLVKLLQSDEEIPYAEVTRALGGILDHIDSGIDFKTLGLYPLILRGLRSNVPDVQILALNQVRKIMEGKGGDEDEVTVALIDCLGAEDARVGEVAVKVLSNLWTQTPYFEREFLRFTLAPSTTTQILRVLDLIAAVQWDTDLQKPNGHFFNTVLPLLNETIEHVKKSDVLMLMNVIQFYTHLADQNTQNPQVRVYLESNLPFVMQNLAPEADPFESLLGPGTCEFLTSLSKLDGFRELDAKYGIVKAIEIHALNPASPQYVPALLAFSKIARNSLLFDSLDPKVIDAYRKMIATRPMTPEKLTSLAMLVSKNSSANLQSFFTFSLNDLVIPYMHDPNMQSSAIIVLKALSEHVWGVKRISDSTTIMEWLQDRQGRDYEEIQGKFDVLESMLQTTRNEERTAGRQELHGPLGKWRAHIEIFVSRGPFWVDSIAAVATEGGGN